jgi:hypothetical protein
MKLSISRSSVLTTLVIAVLLAATPFAVWVWDTPKADLIVRDEKTLQRLNVPATTIKTFMRNPAFPLSVQTAFITNLERLAGVPGSVKAVELASTVRIRSAGAISNRCSRDVGSLQRHSGSDSQTTGPQGDNRTRPQWSDRGSSPVAMAKENLRTLGWTVNEKVNPIPDSIDSR